MSTTGWIILAVVIVVVLLIALAVWRSVRRKEHAARAESLRTEARTHASEIGTTRTQAQEAEVRAEAKRLEAERAQREAEAAKTALAQQEATHEDRLREADRVDPSVNHKARDYEPPTVSGTDGGPGTDRAVNNDGTLGNERAADDGGTLGDAPDGVYHSTGGAHRAQE